jgi:hypothetical protein
MFIVHVDVNGPAISGNETRPGCMTILSGEAPVWKYCIEFHKAIQAGASVIAIGHKFNMENDADSSMVAYSGDPDYKVGEPIRNERLNRPSQKKEQDTTTNVEQALNAIYQIVDEKVVGEMERLRNCL